jgi:hypothetical protein
MLVQRLQGAGITSMAEAHVQHALVWYPEDLDKAYDLLVLANESFEGELKDFNPNVVMVGAINRNMVTCYLDALLFAMFARLDSFEAMLYDEFSDEPRKKLAGILRLWVNLLRTGQLIRVDLVSLSLNFAILLILCNRRSICRKRWPSAAGKKPPWFTSKTLPKRSHLLLAPSTYPSLR